MCVHTYVCVCVYAQLMTGNMITHSLYTIQYCNTFFHCNTAYIIV